MMLVFRLSSSPILVVIKLCFLSALICLDVSYKAVLRIHFLVNWCIIFLHFCGKFFL